MRGWNPRIDVIIPTYKPDGKYDKLINRLTRQTLLPHHIYVINTIPDKGEAKDVRKGLEGIHYLSVRDIPQSEFNHGATRNQGVEQAEAEFVLMMTQDAVPADSHLLERLVEPFRDEKVAVTYARQLATKEVGMIEQYTRQFNYPEEDVAKTKEDLDRLGIKTYFCSDVCAMYRKSVYKELGGFVTRTIFNEDTIMASKIIQAGYTVYYASGAKVYHAHKYTGLQQFKRNFDLGVSHRQYREIFEQVKSESEGVRLVTQTAGYLIKQKKPWKIGELIWQSGWKFLGYRLGKMYDKLPLWLIRRCSSQKAYWEKGKE